MRSPNHPRKGTSGMASGRTCPAVLRALCALCSHGRGRRPGTWAKLAAALLLGDTGLWRGEGFQGGRPASQRREQPPLRRATEAACPRGCRHAAWKVQEARPEAPRRARGRRTRGRPRAAGSPQVSRPRGPGPSPCRCPLASPRTPQGASTRDGAATWRPGPLAARVPPPPSAPHGRRFCSWGNRPPRDQVPPGLASRGQDANPGVRSGGGDRRWPRMEEGSGARRPPPRPVRAAASGARVALERRGRALKVSGGDIHVFIGMGQNF